MPDRENVGGERGYMLPGADTSLWREAHIPCTFEHAAPELYAYRGTVWFRKSFAAQRNPERLLWLEFGAVNYTADVWINGRPAGSHRGGYLPFRMEISSLLSDSGENTLCVRVDNRRVPGMLPNNHFWRGHGGIIRRVSLFTTPAYTVKSVKALLCGEKLELRTAVLNCGSAETELRLEHTVPEVGLTCETRLRVSPGQTQCASVFVPAESFSRWSPESPTVYTVCTELEGDTGTEVVTNSFGVREIGIENGRITLNGRELFLRGFNRHEDSHLADIATDVQTAEADLRAIKAMNGNFVRLCHYPHSEEELDLCDRLGIVAFCEIPFNATLAVNKEYDDAASRKALPQMFENALRDAEEMVERDYNHPSIFFWSAGNETNESDKGIRQINTALVQHLKKLDPSRLAVHVSQGKFWDGKANPDEPLFEADDVICVNAYVTAEHRGAVLTEDTRAEVRQFRDRHLAEFGQKYPGKPVFVTEFGYQTNLPRDGVRAEEAQTETLLCDMDAMDGRVAGYAIWHLTDHAWEISEDGSVFFGSTVSPFGVFTRDRQPKPAAAAVASHWKKAAQDFKAGKNK